MTLANGALARLARAEQDIRDIVEHKADKDDVERLAAEFKALRVTLQWFMGVISAALIAGMTLIIQLMSHV